MTKSASHYLWLLLVNSVAGSALVPEVARFALYRLLGLRVGVSRIAPNCFIGSRAIAIGAGSFLNREVFLDGSAAVRIGNRVRIGPRASLVTSSHNLGDHEMRAGDVTASPIVVEDGVWIGAGATVLPGVTIARGCVIAAGSVVARNCESDGLYAGVPARLVRKLD